MTEMKKRYVKQQSDYVIFLIILYITKKLNGNVTIVSVRRSVSNESNFADLSYSKKLKDEFPDAEWWWSNSRDRLQKEEFEIIKKGTVSWACRKEMGGLLFYPALTTDMLLERLPNKVQILKWENEYIVSYDGNAKFIKDKSLPNALAKMLIWLKENKLL